MPTACSPTFTGRLAGRTAVILNELIILVVTVCVTRANHDMLQLSLYLNFMIIYYDLVWHAQPLSDDELS